MKSKCATNKMLEENYINIPKSVIKINDNKIKNGYELLY